MEPITINFAARTVPGRYLPVALITASKTKCMLIHTTPLHEGRYRNISKRSNGGGCGEFPDPEISPDPDTETGFIPTNS